MNDTDRVRLKLVNLSRSLDDLESNIEPLLAQTLPEALVGLDSIQQAKLQTTISYLVYDLVFIYFKTRGIDPKSQPVFSELERVRSYFEKISNAEKAPGAKQLIDKAAASRFIKHAIAQASRQQQEHPIPEHATSAEVAAETTPVKITQKMVERAEYEHHLRESDTDEEGPDLEIFEEPRQDDDVNVPAQMLATTSYKGKGKMQDPGISQAPALSSLKKRRRPEMDLFDGYNAQKSSGRVPIDNSKRKRKKKGAISASHGEG